MLSWAWLGLQHTWVETGGITAVRVAASLIHLTAGILFLTRSAMVVVPEPRQFLVILPSMVAGGVAFRAASSTQLWPGFAKGGFVLGAVFVVISLGFLGRNFDIVPAVRKVSQRGPYQWIRHPAYFGELLIGVFCGLAAWSWLAGLAVLALFPAMIWRIQVEESMMAALPAYQQYQQQVRWKLLPGIW